MIERITITSRLAIHSLAGFHGDAYQRQATSQLLGKDKWALISLNGYDEEFLPNWVFERQFKGLNCGSKILSLRFDDLNGYIYERILAENRITPEERAKYILFNENHANEILEYVYKLPEDIKHLIIHCHAGISRSSAIGVFFARKFDISPNLIYKEAPHIEPNPYILNKMYEVANENFELHSEWMSRIYK